MTAPDHEAKKLFLIAATDEENSLNRNFADAIRELFNSNPDFNERYTIQAHTQLDCENLYESLEEAIQGDTFEGYIILLDMIDSTKGLCNPNVMFEFGAVKNLNKPFVVIAATSNHPASQFPFDVRALNIGYIPECIADYVKSCTEKGEKVYIRRWFNGLEAKERDAINQFFAVTYSRYVNSLNKSKREKRRNDNIVTKLNQLITTQEGLTEAVKQITGSFSSTAEYIDGEAAAFSSLHEAVSKAKYSLRTSRFANQSIVRAPTREQQAFMEALYAASNNLNSNFLRIICNNHPAKWQDVYNILFHGGHGSSVYVRKADFSIHFELVIIDEQVAFVHFYQQDHSIKGKNVDIEVERINSTLKIQGSSICQKFANIFDRLHHRDFEAAVMQDPSRTLLGIPIDSQGDEPGFAELGRFVIPDNWAETSISTKCLNIINMFKTAFKEWKIDSKDRINMAAGIALLENNSVFIQEMEQLGKLTAEESRTAAEMFEKNRGKP